MLKSKIYEGIETLNDIKRTILNRQGDSCSTSLEDLRKAPAFGFAQGMKFIVVPAKAGILRSQPKYLAQQMYRNPYFAAIFSGLNRNQLIVVSNEW
jgi:hypothetical protein